MTEDLSKNRVMRKFILGRLFLIGLFPWFFFLLLFRDLSFSSYAFLPSFLSSFILIIGLMVGLYLGLRKGGKAIFFYPIIFLCIFGILLGILGIFGVFLAFIGFFNFLGLSFLISISVQTIIFLCLSIIISTFFYFKKENLLIIIFSLILIIIIIGSIGESRYFSKRKEQKLIALREEAIKTENPDLCEDIEKIIHYRPCIEGVAMKTGDETLCDRIEKVVTGSPAYECRRKVIALRTNNIEECGEICDCVTLFAIKENNPDICQKCEYYEKEDCFKRVAVAANKIEICDRINFVDIYNLCITDIAVKQNNSELCKKVKEDYHVINGEKIITFNVDDCLEKVKLKE